MADEMIAIDVALSTTAADREALLGLLRETVAASRAEPGCLTYRASVALGDLLQLYILELWDSEAAYLAHREGAALARFIERLPGCGRIVSIERRAGVLHPYGLAA